MGRPLLPPRYIVAPIGMVFNKDIPDGVLRTWLQLRAMAWGRGVTETPPFSFEQFEALTGTKKFTLYGHLRILDTLAALLWRSSGNATIIVTFPSDGPWSVEFDGQSGDCENPQLLSEGYLINSLKSENLEIPSEGGVGGVCENPQIAEIHNDFCENPQNDARTTLDDLRNRGMQALANGLSRSGDDFRGYPESVIPVLREFCDLFGYHPYEKPKGKRGGKFALWVKAGEDLRRACGEFGLEPLRKERQRIEEYMQKHGGVSPYTWSGPWSIVGMVETQAAQMRTMQGSKPGAGAPSGLVVRCYPERGFNNA